MERIITVTYPSFTDKHTEMIRNAAAGRAEVRFTEYREPIHPDTEVLVGMISPKPLEALHNLKWIQTSFAGVERLVQLLRERGGILLTNASGAFGAGISEFMLAYTLILQKRMTEYMELQKKKEWRFLGITGMIEGSVVTVAGVGDIGGCYARKMKALGATVRGVKRTPGDKPGYIDELYTIDNFDKALENADIVAMCLPDTPETEGTLSRDRIFALKEGAIILNVGRGGAIDQPALADALREKRVFAGLDVTAPEPLPPGDPLWDAPNLVLTPHISGYASNSFAADFVAGLVSRNIAAYLDGRELENVVDLSLGY